MNLDEYKALISLLLQELLKEGFVDGQELLGSRLTVIIENGYIIIPDHKSLFNYVYTSLNKSDYGMSITNIKSFLNHLLQIISIKEKLELHQKEIKIFDSAYDKLTIAAESYRDKNYSSTFNDLNTALELMVKDKFNIPFTMKLIHTSNIIEIAVKEKLGPYAYLNEAKIKVVTLDNKIKHQGYIPTPEEAINAIGIMEEVYRKLQNIKIDIPDDIQSKIYKDLYT